jgi:voltage-gated potassium channel
MREFLHKIVIENDSKRGRWFDIFIQILIILSLISFSFETLPNLDSKYKTILDSFEVFSVIIFSVEYLLRVFLTKPFWKYIFSFFGIIDFLSVLPFYLTTGIDLRSIRIFRLFRLFRIFKLFKYNTALDRINTAFSEIKNELVIFIVATFFLLYVSAIGIYYFENPVQPEVFKSVFHSLWWAVTTLTTVGYGDMYPITIGGKIFTTIIVFIGLGIIAIPTGLLASAFSKTFKNK